MLLAILRPDLTVSLCESVKKKAAAVQAIVTELGVPVSVEACRAEDLLQINTFDTLVVRAVAPLEKLLRWLAPCWEAFDELLVIKGTRWTAERGAARHLGLLQDLQMRKAATYLTPRTDAVNVILKLQRQSEA